MASPAYTAGQQHGANLAVQHATTPAASPAAPFTLEQLTAQAKGLAGQDTASQVAAVKAQQQALLAAAADHARQIALASNAAANLQTGIGNATAASYRQSAGQEAQIAQGYSGDLQTTASDAAANTLAGLQAVGGTADQIKNPGQAGQLGNVLYGLGGAIPANTLLASGEAQAAAQRQLPGATRGYGQQQALGSLAAGDQASKALIPDIVNATAGQGANARSYLSQLISGASAQEQATKDSALLPYLTAGAADKLPGVSPITGLPTSTQQGIDAKKAAAADLADYRKAQLTIQQQHVDVLRSQGATRSQIAEYNAETARMRATASTRPKGMTANQWAGVYQKADKQAETFYWGDPPKQQWNAANGSFVDVPGTGTPQVPYDQAIARMRAAYPELSVAKVKQIIDTNYPAGKAGRPGPIWGNPTAVISG